MAPWQKGQRHSSWASNPNIAVYIFAALFVVWLGFQIWSRIPGGPAPPTQLDPMVMAALGVAISAKSVEKKADERRDKETAKETRDLVERSADRIWDLEEFARYSHPEEAEGKLQPPPPKEGEGTR